MLFRSEAARQQPLLDHLIRPREGRARQPQCAGSVGSRPPPDARARASRSRHTQRAGKPRDRLSRRMQVPRRARRRSGTSACASNGSCEPLADFVNLWALIGQITRGDQRSEASLKLLVAHCHFFVAASIKPMTIASMFRSDRIACWLSFSASSRRSSSVRRSLT